MSYRMASLTRKMIKDRPYYYLRECQRVNGKSRIVRQRYVGSAETVSEVLSDWLDAGQGGVGSSGDGGFESAQMRGVRERYHALAAVLDERSRRLCLGAEARTLGPGGITLVSRATGVSRRTIRVGVQELAEGRSAPPGRREPSSSGPRVWIRRPGGGCRARIEEDSALLDDLKSLVEPDTRGDPENPLRWTCKSVRRLADELKTMGHRTSHRMVAEMLHKQGYSLQGNKKTLEGSDHPDRNAQFEHINTRVQKQMASKNPVISVDSKKKELVGNFKNNGREWCLKGQPTEVNGHDFADPELGKVTPSGVYDQAKNVGWVSVGTDHDTGTFAVETIRRWWKSMGRALYPKATSLLITADGGGSNGYRLRLWKLELQALADELKIPISVCHFPPGTSKWNKIEHRLFSFISQNWRGKPLTSHEVVVNLIANTTTKTGLKVRCELDLNSYPKGRRVTDDELSKVNLTRDPFHGEWNYTIAPACPVSGTVIL